MPTSIDVQPALRPFVVALAIVGAGCGSSPTAPGGPAGPAGPAGPQAAPTVILNSIRIGATPVLRAPGETGQMTVEAFLSNGTSVDRTAEAQWTSQNPGVATVAPGGLVTAVGFGATHIDAVFDGKRSTADVLVTPAGTYAALGVVREPGGGPMAGVLVRELDSGRSATTDQNGVFGFAALQQRARFRVATAGFEVVESDFNPGPSLPNSNIPRLSVDIRLQRIVRLDAGASRSQLTIAPDDVAYFSSPVYCAPCKLIRVATGRTGTLRVTVTPQGTPGTPSRFYVWIDGRQFGFSGSSISAQTAVVGSGEVLVYVGWSVSYYDDFEPGPITFGITTSIDDE